MTALTRAGETIGWLLTRYGITILVVIVILASLCVLRHVPLMTEATAASIWEALGG